MYACDNALAMLQCTIHRGSDTPMCLAYRFFCGFGQRIPSGLMAFCCNQKGRWDEHKPTLWELHWIVTIDWLWSRFAAVVDPIMTSENRLQFPPIRWEMRFEISDGHFSCIATVTTGWDEFHFHLILVSNDFFHRLGDFIIKDRLLWYDSCPFQTHHQLSISSG